MATVYILYSKSVNKFYTGSCKELNMRLAHHFNNETKKGFTKQASDWEVYFQIDNLEYQQARKIEQHIKAMKSRRYIHNLLKYPEIGEKLVDRYK